MSDDELGMEPEGEMAEGFGDFEIPSKFSDFDDEEEKDFHFDLDKGDDDFDFEEDEFEMAPPREAKIKHPHIKDHESHRIEDMLEDVFSESKVDSILKGYFKVDSNEKKLLESKKKQAKVNAESKRREDMKGKKCNTCGKGTYQDESYMDDLKGILHCTNCDEKIQRYKSNENNMKYTTTLEGFVNESKKVKINKIKQLSESISQEVGARKLMEKYPNAKLVGKTNRQNLVFEMNNKQLRVNTKGQVI